MELKGKINVNQEERKAERIQHVYLSLGTGSLWSKLPSLWFSPQLDGQSHSSPPIHSSLISVYAASSRLRCGPFAALSGQTGAVVGGALPGYWIPTGDGGGHRVVLGAPHWDCDGWTHDELWVQNRAEQQHRGIQVVHFLNKIKNTQMPKQNSEHPSFTFKII